MEQDKKSLAPMKEKISIFKNNFAFATALLLSVAGFILFLYQTDFIYNKLLIAAISFIIIYPLRKNSKVVKSYLLCFIAVFAIWLLSMLGSTIVPFVFAIIIGYLLDPIVAKLERKLKVPRWLSALAVIIGAGGVIVTVAIFVFPVLIEQASTITTHISEYVINLKKTGMIDNMFAYLKKIGIDSDMLINYIKSDFLPRIEGLFKAILQLFLSFSDIATQLINIIILPFLTFYFLKDFSQFKNKVKNLLEVENNKIVKYIERFDTVLRTYISWQIIASLIVATVGSIVYSIFSVPYGILLACIAGLLNPIPYFGSIFSIVIGGLVVLLVGDGYFVSNFIIITSVIVGVHFVNAYLLEPTIAGNKVGLHPVMMILSIFIFNALFGILGMLVAVPVTAVIVVFLKDIYYLHINSKK